MIDLPGFKKDEVQVALENGYLTIRAVKGLDEEEKEKKTEGISAGNGMQDPVREASM